MQPNAIASANTTPFTSGTSNRAITSDFETFLRMLTTQIQNQDPLNPVDASDYAVQLATFSSVEQQVLTNDLLKALSRQMETGSLAQMGAWIGQEVRVAAPVWFDGAPVEIMRPIPAPGTEAPVLVVTDPAGTEVQRLALPPGDSPIEWVGATADNLPLPAGLYHLTFETIDDEGSITSESAQSFARVAELRADGGSVNLVLSGGIEVGADMVTGLRPGPS